ncbi:hypothetical protein RFN29_04515 [Mesorhizobium sp. VK22B]|uniref:Uncharacterized protein n=1 Tax=Mesorhizobium captivum TaxID=3072319 RepID=A0ABU4YYG5_9HYPH|nr:MULTISPECIES: hypothetical protein [unclassified Mesorhizobium]MDX8490837.1 hypothetical protein [Mesorhizobium sp. VK22B]MDX8504000.1 hypothetical protein [Mesorhizobium sp. VK22E]
MHVAQKCAAVLGKRHASKQGLKNASPDSVATRLSAFRSMPGSGMKMRGRFDGAMEQGFEAHLEQFQEKCERFSVRNCVKNKEIERFAVSVKR